MLRRPRPPVDAAMPALRRRVSHLIAQRPARFRAFVRAVPLLLCGRLRRPSLDQDPPGLVRAPRRRRWSRLCEQLDLPPVTAWAHVRPLVQCVVLAPSAGGRFELMVVPVEGLGRQEIARISARVDATAQIAQRHAPELDVRMANLAELTPSLFAWGGVVAGELPIGFIPEGPLDWFDVLLRAPTPMLRCLTTLVPRDAPPPLTLLREERLSHLATFTAHWSGSPLARDVVALDEATLSPAELDGLISRLRQGCLEAVRALPAPERRFVRAQLRPVLFARRVPALFRQHLERLIKTRHVREVQEPLGWRLEIEGFVVVRAPSLDALRALALAESVSFKRLEPVWGRLIDLMNAPARPRALAVLEPGFVRHLVVTLPRSGRPRAHRVDAAGLLRFVLLQHRAGVPVELLPSGGADPTLAARVSQLLGSTTTTHEHLAFQMGKQVLLVGEGRARLVPIDKAFTRPRTMHWLPESAEHARALRPPLHTGLPTLHVVALPENDESAALFALDSRGALFREVVPLTALQLTLQDYRALAGHLSPATLVSASVHPLLTSLDGRRTERFEPVQLELELSEKGARVRFCDEWFGRGCELNYSALAEAILSHWSPGVWAPLSLAKVIAPVGSPPLLLLAARSRVLRRVDSHLRRIARTLRAA